ncbi:hypothetical protein C8R44DRAFT_990910 [Mycena epipterygia]|nr:hypothetical protein C8R44DRAFT_990910 [Mycena epipterygia]
MAKERPRRGVTRRRAVNEEIIRRNNGGYSNRGLVGDLRFIQQEKELGWAGTPSPNPCPLSDVPAPLPPRSPPPRPDLPPLFEDPAWNLATLSGPYSPPSTPPPPPPAAHPPRAPHPDEGPPREYTRISTIRPPPPQRKSTLEPCSLLLRPLDYRLPVYPPTRLPRTPTQTQTLAFTPSTLDLNSRQHTPDTPRHQVR